MLLCDGVSAAAAVAHVSLLRPPQQHCRQHQPQHHLLLLTLWACRQMQQAMLPLQLQQLPPLPLLDASCPHLLT
jgi:hypothetical protein